MKKYTAIYNYFFLNWESIILFFSFFKIFFYYLSFYQSFSFFTDWFFLVFYFSHSRLFTRSFFHNLFLFLLLSFSQCDQMSTFLHYFLSVIVSEVDSPKLLLQCKKLSLTTSEPPARLCERIQMERLSHTRLKDY